MQAGTRAAHAPAHPPTHPPTPPSQLEPLSGGRTKLTHGEDFSGLLVPLLGSTLKATVVGFGQLNEALKTRAEGKA